MQKVAQVKAKVKRAKQSMTVGLWSRDDGPRYR